MTNIMEMLRFAGVGIAATCVHAGMAALLYQMTQIDPHLINIIGFLVAFGASAIGHTVWTFQQETKRLRSVRRFFIIALTGFLASIAIMRMALIQPYLDIWHAQFLAIVIIPPVSYLGSKFWAFRPETA